MAIDLDVREQAESTATAQPGTVPVERVLDFVRRDSRQESARYLEETTVPHGGE